MLAGLLHDTRARRRLALMYRQTVALSIQRNRPGLVDVRIAPPEAMEDELASFRPHLLLHNDLRAGIAPVREVALQAVPYGMEMLYSDGMNARLSADGRVTELRNASTEDLLGSVDAASKVAGGGKAPPRSRQALPVPTPPPRR